MASSNISLIIPLMDAAQSRKAGCKAINLSKLVAARFAVPRGFVISADAHSFHLWASGIRNIATSMETPEARESARAAIMAGDIPKDIWTGVAEAYHRLSLQVGFADPKVVVCSSPLEDGRSDVHCEIFGVSGLDALKDAIRQVWTTPWSEDAVDGGVGNDEPALAVIVRQMIESGPRGVACTADPSTGDPRVVAIVCENGDAPARFTVDLREVRIAEHEGELPDELNEFEIVRLAEQAVLAERVVCSPIQVDWVYECGAFWILEAGEVSDGRCFAGGCRIESVDEAGGRRVSSKPVSYMARKLFWTGNRGADGPFPAVADAQLVDGYAVCSGLEKTPTEAQRWQATAEKSLEKWRNDVWPEIGARAAAMVNTDLAEVEYSKLIELLSEAGELAGRAANWLEMAKYPSAQYPELLREMLSGLEGDSELYDRLLGGLACPTFMRNARLQELADRFAAAEVSGQLSDEKWWRAYRQDVERFAGDYGYAFTDTGEMADPACWKSWVEELDTVFRMIGALSRRGNRPSLVTLHCAAEESATGAEKEAAGLLKAGDRARFGKAVKATRGWLCASDESEQAFALACTALRLVAMELGRRLCDAGTIALRDDVFSLAIDELRAIGEDPSDDERTELIARIAARKHDVWLEERLARSNAAQVAAPAGESADIICGQVVSPGRVSGRVRLALSVVDAGEMEAGDILVVRSLSSAWTPFLGVAGGIVSEVKPTSCLAVARDYGVPIVAGCAGVSDLIENGHRITVDGSAGTIDLRGS